MAMHRVSRLLVIVLLLSGCASLIEERQRAIADNLGRAMLNQDDAILVETALPAYLLLMDSFALDADDNPSVLSAGARLYGAYATLFVGDAARSRRLADKSLDYAMRAFCQYAEMETCQLGVIKLDTFKRLIADLDEDEPETPAMLFSLGSSWAGWIQIHRDRLDAVADLPKVRALMERLVKIRPDYQSGDAYLYLGVLDSLLPASLGGHPEEAKANFESAIRLSKGRNLFAKVLFAKHYARLVFDQALHDQLLQQVLAADPHAEGFTLANTMARKEARSLLDASNDYF